MATIRIEAVMEQDGELHLTGIPARKGDRVEAVVHVIESKLDDREREEALQRFLERARASQARSTGPYPKRDELYDRTL